MSFLLQPTPDTIKYQGAIRNDGTGKLVPSRSMPNIGRPYESMRDTKLLADAGTSISSRDERFDEPQPAILMPACYASHRALGDAYRKNPRLFHGQGKPENRHSENFFPANFRHSAVNALAYQRRQTLLPEVDMLHRSKKSDGFLRHTISKDWNTHGGMMDSGATLAVIHRDLR